VASGCLEADVDDEEKRAQMLGTLQKMTEEIHDNTILGDGTKAKHAKATRRVPLVRQRLTKQESRDLRRITGTRIIRPHRLKVPRNSPCPCGSGRKYKKCCGAPPAIKPKVQAVRTMPSAIVAPKGNRALGPDGMPLIVTPRDVDPMGHKDIVTAEDIEREFDAMVKRKVEESKDEPPGKIVVVSK
jgi:hypothetical protein